MYTKIEYCNDGDGTDYWYVYLTNKTETDFDLLLEESEKEFEYFEIQCVNCPTVYDDEYIDTFSVERGIMDKGEFMKEFRRIIPCPNGFNPKSSLGWL